MIWEGFELPKAEKAQRHLNNGGLVCERASGEIMCLETAEDYKRNAREAKDWPNPNTPIALCKKHSKGRIKI
jgi:hypothetical protein